MIITLQENALITFLVHKSHSVAFKGYDRECISIPLIWVTFDREVIDSCIAKGLISQHGQSLFIERSK